MVTTPSRSLTCGTGPSNVELVHARLEQETCTIQATDRGRVLGLRAGLPVGRVAKGVRLVTRHRRHPRQKVVDDGQLLVGVLRDLGGGLLAELVHRGLDRDHLLGDELDDHASAVGRVGDTPDVAPLLEAVDDARDRAGRQAHQLREATGRRSAGIQQDR